MEKEYRDLEPQCKEEECRKPFTLSAGEQRFFDRHAVDDKGIRKEIDPNLTDAEIQNMGLKRMRTPMRCPECRMRKKKLSGRLNSPFSVLLGKEFRK